MLAVGRGGCPLLARSCHAHPLGFAHRVGTIDSLSTVRAGGVFFHLHAVCLPRDPRIIWR